MLKAKMGAAEKSKYTDNGWFVGVEPRRNPEIVVSALFEEGEHGALAARVVSQVIKAYVDKQRKQPTKLAGTDKKVEVGAVWTNADPDNPTEEKLQAGRFVLNVRKRLLPLAMGAPGLQ
jgi:penicillin-binding protein 2